MINTKNSRLPMLLPLVALTSLGPMFNTIVLAHAVHTQLFCYILELHKLLAKCTSLMFRATNLDQAYFCHTIFLQNVLDLVLESY